MLNTNKLQQVKGFTKKTGKSMQKWTNGRRINTKSQDSGGWHQNLIVSNLKNSSKILHSLSEIKRLLFKLLLVLKGGRAAKTEIKSKKNSECKHYVTARLSAFS